MLVFAVWGTHGIAGTATRTLFASGPVGFTASQAQRGQAAYVKSCASCHGRHLNDGQFGPAVKGAAFRAHWNDQSPEALRAVIVQRMPPASPGSLDSGTYTDIEAYLLRENGEKAGLTALAASEAPVVSAGGLRGSAGGSVGAAPMTPRVTARSNRSTRPPCTTWVLPGRWRCPLARMKPRP
jgi:mono/diheme cytochrome c family protein